MPQGRILGPILFKFYASTLTEIIPESNDSFLSGYADDHAIMHSFNPDNKNIKQKIENDIGKIKTWMEENQLKMNDAKTDFIVLGTSNNLRKSPWIKLKLEKQKFTKLPKLNFLGVILDEQLNVKATFRTDLKKANYNLMLIHNIHK